MKKKFETGLVLSGGAVRGFVHLGVLKALEEHDLKPDIISSVSAGSIAGAFYADGFRPEEILEIFKAKHLFELMQVTVPRTGFFSAKGIRTTLENNLRAKTFRELKIPLIIAATDVLKGTIRYFSKGNLVEAILASSCVPVLFEIITIDGVQYVDGGVINNMPVEPLAGKCRKLIGVYIIPAGEIQKVKGIMHMAERAFYLSMASKIMDKESMFDLFISPREIVEYGFFDLKKADELFKLGYKTAKEALNRASRISA